MSVIVIVDVLCNRYWCPGASISRVGVQTKADTINYFILIATPRNLLSCGLTLNVYFPLPVKFILEARFVAAFHREFKKMK